MRYFLIFDLRVFTGTDLPLLAEKGYLAANSKNNLAASCKKVASNYDDMKNVSSKSDVNIMFESEAHTERGSPSLVGRGIANPQELPSCCYCRRF
jgi:hypothetical protein